MTAARTTVFFHSGGKSPNGPILPVGWYCTSSTGFVPIDLVMPGAVDKKGGPLIKVGALAVDAHYAVAAIQSAKGRYYARIRKFEEIYGHVEGRIDPVDPKYKAIRNYTQLQFAALLEAKRKAYNIKRRLENACRKVGNV